MTLASSGAPGSDQDDKPRNPTGRVTRESGSVTHACLWTAGSLVTTLVTLETALVTAELGAAALVVAITIGVLILGTLTVAAMDVWRNGR
jgi:hypothetical protein